MRKVDHRKKRETGKKKIMSKLREMGYWKFKKYGENNKVLKLFNSFQNWSTDASMHNLHLIVHSLVVVLEGNSKSLRIIHVKRKDDVVLKGNERDTTISGHYYNNSNIHKGLETEKT